MGNRRKKRFARRLQVRFWKHGEESAHTAYTTNVSASGMFIGTSSPLPPASRVRLELIHEGRSFMLEGEVAHSARVSPLLSQIKSSGMGVRFLSVPELISEILPAVTAAEIAADEAAPAAAEQPSEEVAPEVAPTESSGSELAAAAPSPEPARAASRPDREKPSEPVRDPAPERLEMKEGRVVELHFESLPHFLKVLQRDIASGGLFVPNVEGLTVDERIEIDLRLPPPVDQVVRITGKVVHLTVDEEKANLLAGAGLQIFESEDVSRRLQKIIYSE